MRILAQRVMRGPNQYAPHGVCRLVVRARADAAALARALRMTGLEVDGADPARLVGSLALALQRAAGIAAEGIAAGRDGDGDWVVAYGYGSEAGGEEAGRQAVHLAGAATRGDALVVEEAVAAVQAAHARDAPSESVAAVLEAARQRGIPVTRRDANHHQLGWGVMQQALWGSVTGRASGLGYDIANDHERVMRLLENTGIPVPAGESRRSLEGCVELAKQLGYPVAVKPLRGRGGVTPLVAGPADLERAYARAKGLHRWVVVQNHVPGVPHSVLVVGDRVIGATRRSDGADVTDVLHPGVVLACRRAARLAGLDVVGVDLVAARLDVDLAASGGRVVALDPEPSLGPFLARGAADAIVDLLFPTGNGRIPLVAVTGTNGKTTTVRLIGHILKYAGARVGMNCTGVIEVENQVILRGDYSGPRAARTVLSEPSVTHAVCETARGGILREGLGFDQCDVGVLLNIARDHMGQGGIDSLEDLARLKRVVVHAVRPGGTAVLNADDALSWNSRAALQCRIVPFTMDPHHPDVAAHLRADPQNAAVTVNDGAIVLRRQGVEFRVAPVVDIPLTLEGAALFNIQNAMAATAAVYALGVSEEDCRAGLLTFNPSMNQLPGRMNLMRLGGVKVLLDYGHNVPALNALAAVLPRLARGRKINVANAAGNRRDEDLHAFGETIAGMYDLIFLSDPDPRRRPPGETAERIRAGVLAAGFPAERLVVELDEMRALRLALAESRPGDLVVLQADNVEGAIELCREIMGRLDAGESPADLNRQLLEPTP